MRGGRAPLLLALLAFGAGSAGSMPSVVEAPSASAAAAPGAPVAFSLFAIGDPGRSGRFHHGRRHVVDALHRLDEERPASALVLLGDYFHPDGLDAADPAAHVRRALVEPFGDFGTRTIVGVIGNHDLPRPGANAREVTGEILRASLPAWHGGDAAVEHVRLAPGLDLVSYDSTSEDPDLPRRLETALRATPGPWRIVIGHHPLRADWGLPYEQARADALRAAVARAGVPVQLALAGHDHNLQVLDLEEPGLGLQVVSGSGSGHRRVRGDVADRWLGVDELGLVRVDWIEPASGGALRVIVYSVGSGPLPSSWPRPWPSIVRAEGVFEIDASGRAWPVAG